MNDGGIRRKSKERWIWEEYTINADSEQVGWMSKANGQEGQEDHVGQELGQ